MKYLVPAYIQSKQLAWARSSIKNERYRLMFHGDSVLENPENVYVRLRGGGMINHSIKTTFTRLGRYHEWLVEHDHIAPAKNPWKAFLNANALQFKHCYQPERLTVTFDEAKERILGSVEKPWQTAALPDAGGGSTVLRVKNVRWAPCHWEGIQAQSGISSRGAVQIPLYGLIFGSVRSFEGGRPQASHPTQTLRHEVLMRSWGRRHRRLRGVRVGVDRDVTEIQAAQTTRTPVRDVATGDSVTAA